MSGSTGALADSELVDARRFAGYPAYGSGPTDDTFQRFFDADLRLEYRLANLDPAELVVCRNFLADLNAAEASIRAARATLNVDTAAVFKRNANEMNERWNADYRQQRREFCFFLGVPPGAGVAGSPNNAKLLI